MARYSAQELLSKITSDFVSGQGLTSPNVAARIADYARHLPSVTTADGFIFQIGSDPDNWFDMTLLQESDGGGINNTGYQLVPMITGNGTQVNPTAGGALPSNAFDGVSEIDAGTGGQANTIKISYTGQYICTGYCFPEAQENNRQMEVDLFLFDSAGNYKSQLLLPAIVNNSSGGRSADVKTFPVTLESNTGFVAGDSVGMGIRKIEGEGITNVTVKKCAIALTLIGMGQ